MSDEPLLDIVLEPNPPLPPRGVFVVLGGVALLSFIAGMVFVLRGAWPVTPFLGADVLLLAFAFRAVARRARRREILSLTRESLTLQRIGADGRISREEINPYWLHVEHDDPEGVGAPLALVMRGRRWVIGSFLGAEERSELAQILREKLRDAREAPYRGNPNTSLMP